MISAGHLQAREGIEGIAAFLREAGYDVRLRPIEPERWEAVGVDRELARRLILSHAARHGHVDVFVGGGPREPREITLFLEAISRWNVVTKFVLIYQHFSPRRVSLYGLDSKARARRIDLDPVSPRRDALDRFAALELRDRRPGELERALERALERESVGRRFFLRFRDDARSLEAELLRLHPDEGSVERAAEALLILSRVLFLYFVQQKGWLDGNRSFLIDLVERSRRVREGLFTGVFLPLFFGCLNTPEGRRDPLARRFGRIPYLNGGLFERSAFERRHPVIGIDDALLERVILGTFERFQFVIEEDDETGAHIDPEMLGRVFENLMAESERLASGSFYTPKCVVDVLVRNALAARLAPPAGCGADALASFLSGDSRGLELPDPALFRRELEGLRVIDPACGSGAFLLSALQHLERLAGAAGAGDGRRDPRARRRILERLYGVDLKPEAVRLCELRLWLAVAASEPAEPAAVEPLPNLDRNILQGNTLLGPLDWIGARRLDIYRAGAARLRERAALIGRFREARGRQRETLARALRDSDRALALDVLDRSLAADRDALEDLTRRQPSLFGGAARRVRTDARDLTQRIARAEEERRRIAEGEIGYFAAEVHFAEAAAAGGFDLVVGNPPWVRSSRIDPAVRRLVAERYESFGGTGGGDGIPQGELALAFFERSLALAKDQGAVSLLMPQKIVTSGYASAWRARVARAGSLLWLRDWSEEARKLFDADTFPLGVLVRKGGRGGMVRIERASSSFRIQQGRLPLSRGGPWVLADERVRAILDRMARDMPPFGERIARPVMGVKTGANGDFFVEPEIDWARAEALVEGVPIPLADLARVVRGRDVARWTASDSLWMLRPTRSSAWLPALVASRRGRPVGALAYERREHRGWKVIWKDVSRGIMAAPLAPSRSLNGVAVAVVPNQTVYCAAVRNEEEAWFAAALLNSTAAGAAALAVADRAKDFHYRYFGRTIARVPVPDIAPAARRRIASLAKSAASDRAAEAELDRVLSVAYGLSADDAEGLGRFVRERLGRI